MQIDSTFDLERRRNVIGRYNRDTAANTVNAITRISEIQQARAKRFHKERFAGVKAKQTQQARMEIAQGEELVRPAAAVLAKARAEAKESVRLEGGLSMERASAMEGAQ